MKKVGSPGGMMQKDKGNLGSALSESRTDTPPRGFHIGDILTVTTGTLLSPRHMTGVYDILQHMTGEQIWTHQMARVMDECRPDLLKQHPQIADVDTTSVTRENVWQWLAMQVDRFGEMLPVAPLPEHAHESIDPISELAEKIHPDRITVIATVA